MKAYEGLKSVFHFGGEAYGKFEEETRFFFDRAKAEAWVMSTINKVYDWDGNLVDTDDGRLKGWGRVYEIEIEE